MDTVRTSWLPSGKEIALSWEASQGGKLHHIRLQYEAWGVGVLTTTVRVSLHETLLADLTWRPSHAPKRLHHDSWYYFIETPTFPSYRLVPGDTIRVVGRASTPWWGRVIFPRVRITFSVEVS